jgi:GTPase SAR1 family protein
LIGSIQVWDTVGQDDVLTLTAHFLRNSHCAIFVYDITNRKSFDALEAYVRRFDEKQNRQANGKQRWLYLIVGTKLDVVQHLASRRQVTVDMIEKWMFKTNKQYNVQG